jgi:hypothetical protein
MNYSKSFHMDSIKKTALARRCEIQLKSRLRTATNHELVLPRVPVVYNARGGNQAVSGTYTIALDKTAKI